MKNYLRITLSILMVFGAILLFESCGGDTTTLPTNVIEDADGIKVDLDWTTGGSSNDALQQCDLDLYIYKNSTKVLQGGSSSSFERVTFDSDLYADGKYTVAVYLFETSKDASYTVTINGFTASKPYTFNSTFSGTDDNREVSVLTITKLGKKFTVSPIN